MRDTRVATVQMESVPGDKEANFSKVERLAREASETV
jgi:predicted amidohydrolase